MYITRRNRYTTYVVIMTLHMSLSEYVIRPKKINSAGNGNRYDIYVTEDANIQVYRLSHKNKCNGYEESSPARVDLLKHSDSSGGVQHYVESRPPHAVDRVPRVLRGTHPKYVLSKAQ